MSKLADILKCIIEHDGYVFDQNQPAMHGDFTTVYFYDPAAPKKDGMPYVVSFSITALEEFQNSGSEQLAHLIEERYRQAVDNLKAAA